MNEPCNQPLIPDTQKNQMPIAAEMPVDKKTGRFLPVFASFWDRVHKTDYCWLWTGPVDEKGYGLHTRGDVTFRSHRFAYSECKGPIPTGMLAFHKCDNPPCCNPDHLFLGTYADNAHDRDKKGRQRAPRGEDHVNAKLKNADVLEISSLLSDGVSSREIENRFGISQSCVSLIKLKRTWRHLW